MGNEIRITKQANKVMVDVLTEAIEKAKHEGKVLVLHKDYRNDMITKHETVCITAL